VNSNWGKNIFVGSQDWFMEGYQLHRNFLQIHIFKLCQSEIDNQIRLSDLWCTWGDNDGCGSLVPVVKVG